MTTKIIALCGSTRAQSSNHLLIETIRQMLLPNTEVELYNQIDQLPHFNPDLDHENPPAKVQEFRRILRSGNAILICTPEYAMGVPGTLKNAIDWTVSSCEFYQKPTALITASSLGHKGHAALLETLKIIEAQVENTELVILGIRMKMDAQGVITDAETFKQLEKILTTFIHKINDTP